MLRTWWRDRVDYDVLVETLESHAALGPVKVFLGSGGLVSLLITMLLVQVHGGLTGPAGIVQDVVVAVFDIAWTVRWWFLPLPREVESLWLVAMADLATTANSVMVRDRLLGAAGIVLLVTIGGYVAIFHGPRILALHVAWSMLAITFIATLMATGTGGFAVHEGDVALAFGVVLANFMVSAVVLPAMHFVYWLLRVDSLTDPLTLLLNRRGLDSQLAHFFGSCDRGEVYVVMLDLDRFKAVNDTFGHARGDQVLVRTADCLRAAAPAGALVARTGGEEFVVAGCLREESIESAAERLRGAIERMRDLPVPITTSVGAAAYDATRLRDHNLEKITRSLLRSSDGAMYQAKRMGGNAVVIADEDQTMVR
ncbi:diguanylate cyclase (GGDEF)-like protein [Nocardia pseudobrasiliensis]|uniref:Diguanylate cyclase (GGDEF)-like protein n=2 Tax=Nocardia pseudobrasiliensis TaxID=45979 RepID=A0A370IBU5_9NOCA|nr:diguanylate cyclase (GGDEF)-like protein [Nocardia pseudobrasiliensis]